MDQLINENQIFLEEEFRSKNELLEFVAHKAEVLGITSSRKELVEDLLEREEQMSTGLMDGIAIPHAKSDSVEAAAIMFIRASNPLLWEMMDETQPRCFFVLLVPKKDSKNIHLQMISKLATSLLEQDFRTEVFKESDPKKLAMQINTLIELKEAM